MQYKYNSQTYLDCYQNLYNPQKSKQSNKTLLKIQQSQQAWQIASQLMSHQNQKFNIHGSQLLSNKLNNSLPNEIKQQVLAQFILSLKSIKNIHWLCLAKLFIHSHLNLKNLLITGELSLDVKLNIMKEIPYALTQMKINLQSGGKSSQYRKEVFNQNKYLITQGINFLKINKQIDQLIKQKLSDLIIETLQNYSQHSVTFQSQQIAFFVLNYCQFKLDKSISLLEYIFLEQKYPQLQHMFQEFLQKNVKQNKNLEWIKSLYINFYNQEHINQKLSLEKFKYVIKNILRFMSVEQIQDFRSILADSFNFWNKITQNIRLKNEKGGNQNPLSQININKFQIIKQALLQLFKILCIRSQLKKCPQKIKKIQQKLNIINIDDQQDLEQLTSMNQNHEQNDQLNYNSNQIRSLSADYFVKIFQTLKGDEEAQKFLYQELYLFLSNNNLQKFELAIFIIDTLSDFTTDQKEISYMEKLIQIILKQKNMLNQYICSKIVILLGKIDKIIVSSNVQFIPLVFQFFSKTIFYQKLSIIASQSFVQLMESYQHKNQIKSQQFKENTQNYLNLWFDSFYGTVKNQKVVENITKALTIFIYKFKGSNFYEQFLLLLEEKINTLNDVNYKLKCVQAVTTAQYWINSGNKIQSKPYLIIYSNFMNKFIDLLYSNCINVNKKTDFSKGISKIGWPIKAGCFYTDLNKWLLLLRQLMNKAFFTSFQNIHSITLTLLISLMKSQIKLQQHIIMIDNFIRQILPHVNNNLKSFHLSLNEKIDYSLTKYTLQINNLYLLSLQSRQTNTNIPINVLCLYNPEQLLPFVISKIFHNKTIWQFQVMKQSLIYLNLLIKFNYNPQKICQQIIKVSSRTYESLWIQTENIYFQIYKKYGIQIFVKIIERIKPQILSPNPLFNLLKEGLENCDRKILKGFVRCL